MRKSVYKLEYAYEYLLDMVLLRAWMNNEQLDVLLDKSKESYILVHCNYKDAMYIKSKLNEYDKRARWIRYNKNTKRGRKIFMG